MKDVPTTKTLLTIAAMAMATAGLVACGNSDVDKSPDSAPTDQSALSDDASEAQVVESGLPADVPFYLGERNDDAASLSPGYWRWNSEDSTSSHEQIITNVKQAAQEKGWEMASEQKQSENTYQMVFSKDGNEVVVTINPEGDSHRVSYEYLSETFLKANRK